MFHAFKVKLARLDWVLSIGVIILLSLSILEIYSLSPSLNDGFLMFKKQILFVLLGILLIFSFAFFDYRFFKENIGITLILYIFNTGLLITLIIIGKAIGGAKSWFSLGIFSLEPVELMKITLILILAKFFSLRHVEIFLPRYLIISLIYLLLPLILVVLQPDLGSALILIFIWFGILIVSGLRRKQTLYILLSALLIIFSSWSFLIKDYQKARVISYFAPQEDLLGQGYNLVQSLTAISNGGLLGKGLGNGSVAQLGFLPSRHTDFIFASIAEEMGLIGVIILIAGYLIILWRLIKIALSARDNFGRLLIMGTFILIASHCFINLGMNVGFLPITGISLPFISYGGSGMVSFLVLVGICLSVKVNE
ncbi:rod shape-determining protein RodA [bacterium]|nr:MAG: rod shape-determining protein RodA [bacterium]